MDKDTNSPVGVLEDFFRSSDSDDESSSPTDDSVAAQQFSGADSGWRRFFGLLRSKSKKSLAPLQHPLKLSKRMSSSMRETVSRTFSFRVHTDLQQYLKSPWKNFTLYELKSATKNFSQENLIGKGGYAEVYKGRLQDGRIIAIKQLIKGTLDDIIGDFLSELGIMAHVSHPNATKLIGYGVEGGMFLVLEYSPRGSLASQLYGSNGRLEWHTRYKIALGTAEGLLYLHEGCQRRIIHRDIKAANILLMDDFEPKICDFGLAKWLPEKWTHQIVSKFEGTFGYLAPEYLMHGIVDEKTDVFSFGVLLLELATGRRALDYSQQSLVLWAKPLLKKNDVKELVDPKLGDDYDVRQMNLLLLSASLCIQQSSICRPSMSQVVEVLNGDLNCLKSVKKSRVPFFKKAFSAEPVGAADYKSSLHGSKTDTSRHNKVALAL